MSGYPTKSSFTTTSSIVMRSFGGGACLCGGFSWRLSSGEGIEVITSTFFSQVKYLAYSILLLIFCGLQPDATSIYFTIMVDILIVMSLLMSFCRHILKSVFYKLSFNYLSLTARLVL